MLGDLGLKNLQNRLKKETTMRFSFSKGGECYEEGQNTVDLVDTDL